MSFDERFDVIVIGAGHAGLAMSRCLTERSIDHVVLERGEVANSWRTERWDSLRLLTPNWQSRLPGFGYEGDDPDGSEDLLWMLDADPLTYRNFAEEYYERSVNLEAVRQIYDHTLLTENLALKLSHELSWDALKKDALEIGYPIL